jgi:hypothetical protein
VAKHIEGIFPLCLAEKQNAELKRPMWGWGDSAAYGKSQTLHCLRESGSKLKLTVSPREKLNSFLTHRLAP